MEYFRKWKRKFVFVNFFIICMCVILDKNINSNGKYKRCLVKLSLNMNSIKKPGLARFNYVKYK